LFQEYEDGSASDRSLAECDLIADGASMDVLISCGLFGHSGTPIGNAGTKEICSGCWESMGLSCLWKSSARRALC